MSIAKEKIAKICHQANKAYCEVLGDDSQPEWENAEEWQRMSAVLGVEFNIENPDAPPSASHESWLQTKAEQGWKYGEVKDPNKREHPCYLPYDELPEAQKVKDKIFKSIVNAITGNA